ncbi:MAG: MBL fold metallo-hydrolase [Patescibacteria group bacterium]
MVIKKLGHCCMVIEENGLRILTDPGTYSTLQSEEKNVDVILITHEHADHYHVDSVRAILKNNPRAKIITNSAVIALLAKDGIQCQILEDSQKITENGVVIEGIGNVHAVIYPSLQPVQNTGYFIADRLFYPGDALVNPGRQVEILAVPIAGPWLRMSEGIDYAKELKPKICFPVHDGILKVPGLVHRIPQMILEPIGIKFKVLEIGKPEEF